METEVNGVLEYWSIGGMRARGESLLVQTCGGRAGLNAAAVAVLFWQCRRFLASSGAANTRRSIRSRARTYLGYTSR
jgi:hypothetical protein